MPEQEILHQVAEAARHLGVPQAWLRAEALADRIPHWRAGKRILVHLPTVARLLVERAVPSTTSEGPKQDGEAPARAQGSR